MINIFIWLILYSKFELTYLSLFLNPRFICWTLFLIAGFIYLPFFLHSIVATLLASPLCLFLTSGLIWRTVSPCALSSHTTASSSRRTSDLSSGAITRLSKEKKTVQKWTDLVTARANFTLLFVRTSSVKNVSHERLSRRNRDRSGAKEFPEDSSGALLQLVDRLLKPREGFVQSVHSSRVLVNLNKTMGR